MNDELNATGLQFSVQRSYFLLTNMKTLRLSFAGLLLLAACALPCAAQGGGFTLGQVLSSPFPADLGAARRGSRVAWTFDAEGRRNVWVAEGPQFQARQLTRYDKDDGQMLGELAFSVERSEERRVGK